MNGTWKHIERQLSHIISKDITFPNIQAVGGGCINQAWKITDNENNNWFIKTNHARLLPMFEAEFLGLKELHESHSIRTPKPIHYGKVGHHCYLVMEYISLHGRNQPCLAGQQLAKLHQTQSDQ